MIDRLSAKIAAFFIVNSTLLLISNSIKIRNKCNLHWLLDIDNPMNRQTARHDDWKEFQLRFFLVITSTISNTKSMSLLNSRKKFVHRFVKRSLFLCQKSNKVCLPLLAAAVLLVFLVCGLLLCCCRPTMLSSLQISSEMQQ